MCWDVGCSWIYNYKQHLLFPYINYHFSRWITMHQDSSLFISYPNFITCIFSIFPEVSSCTSKFSRVIGLPGLRVNQTECGASLHWLAMVYDHDYYGIITAFPPFNVGLELGHAFTNTSTMTMPSLHLFIVSFFDYHLPSPLIIRLQSRSSRFFF